MIPHRIPPTETETDRLLASRIRSTTPEFEARWRDQLRLMRAAPAGRRGGWRAQVTWLGLMATGALAAVCLWVFTPARPVRPTEFSATFQELVAVDPVLVRALPLLEPENRAALLHLPVNPSPSP